MDGIGFKTKFKVGFEIRIEVKFGAEVGRADALATTVCSAAED
jgi:hypothetical protein